MIVFQSIAPVGLEARHLIAALPAAVMFVIAGAFAAVTRCFRIETGMPRSSAFPELALVAVVALSAGLFWFVKPMRKDFRGFRPIAETIAPGSRSLISSDSRGEGMFISEVAMREKRPGSTIERASKALASSSWSGGGYHAKFATDDDLLRHLRGAKLDFIVLDDAVPDDKRLTHHDQLKRVLEAHADTFTLAGEFPIWRAGERQPVPLRLYRSRR